MGKEFLEQLTSALDKANPVMSFGEAFDGIPFDKINERPNGLPYSIWELCTHLRIAQHNYLETSRNPNYISPKWPDDFWPHQNHPTQKEWNDCITQIHSERKEMIAYLNSAEDKLFVPLTGHPGRTLFSQAMAMARHNSYHTGEVVVLRRLLGIWK